MTSTPLAAPVSVFKGSTEVIPVETVSLGNILQRIKDGTYRSHVERLRCILTTKGEDAYDIAKKNSTAFTAAGTFTQRNGHSLETPSACLNLDLDDVTDLDHARVLIG